MKHLRVVIVVSTFIFEKR